MKMKQSDGAKQVKKSFSFVVVFDAPESLVDDANTRKRIQKFTQRILKDTLSDEIWQLDQNFPEITKIAVSQPEVLRRGPNRITSRE